MACPYVISSPPLLSFCFLVLLQSYSFQTAWKTPSYQRVCILFIIRFFLVFSRTYILYIHNINILPPSLHFQCYNVTTFLLRSSVHCAIFKFALNQPHFLFIYNNIRLPSTICLCQLFITSSVPSFCLISFSFFFFLFCLCL